MMNIKISVVQLLVGHILLVVAGFFLVIPQLADGLAKSHFIEYENDRVTIEHLEGVVGQQVELPCDISTNRREDTVYMVLWFRITESKPLYTFDVRGRGIKSAKSWSSTTGFGQRANFHLTSSPAHLSVRDLKTSDQGVYRCRVDFKNSRTRNSLVNLTVIVPPSLPTIYDGNDFEVTSELGPYTEGSDVHLKCRVRGGKPEPTVSWFVNGILVDSTSYLNGYGEVINEYIFENVNRSHLNFIFTCKASNTRRIEPVERSVVLELTLSPLFVRLRRKQIDHHHPNIVAGAEYHVSCETAGSRPSALVKWIKSGKEITPQSTQELDDGNITISRLNFVPTPEDNGASLVCRVENPTLPPKSTFSLLQDIWHLNVIYLPQVQLSLGSTVNPYEIKSGSDTFFDCHIQANPKIIRLQWLHNDEILRQSIGAGVIMSNQSLVLQGINRKTAGNYTCLATNSLGSTESNVVNLRVMHAPVCLNEGGITVGATIGETAGLRCAVDSNPSTVTFEWEFHSTGENVDVIPLGKTVSQDDLSRFFYTPTESTFGTFLCWARNSMGRQVQPCVFHVIPAVKPEPLQGCTISNQTETLIQVECSKERDLPEVPAHPLAHLIDEREEKLDEQQAHQSQTDYYGLFPEYFVMEVWDLQNRSIRRNLSAEVPVFTLKGLVPGSWLKLILYAANSHGKSEPIIMEAIVPGGEQAQIFGASKSPWDMFPVIVIGVGTSCAGILLLLILALIIRPCVHYSSTSSHSRHLLRPNGNSTIATPVLSEKIPHNDSAETMMLMSTLAAKKEVGIIPSYESIVKSSDKKELDKNPDLIPDGNYLAAAYGNGDCPSKEEDVQDTSAEHLHASDLAAGVFDRSYQGNYTFYIHSQCSNTEADGNSHNHHFPPSSLCEAQDQLQPLNITTEDPSSSSFSSSTSSRQKQVPSKSSSNNTLTNNDYNTIYIRDKLLYDSKIPESCV